MKVDLKKEGLELSLPKKIRDTETGKDVEVYELLDSDDKRSLNSTVCSFAVVSACGCRIDAGQR
jgi:hypothetical protein